MSVNRIFVSFSLLACAAALPVASLHAQRGSPAESEVHLPTPDAPSPAQAPVPARLDGDAGAPVARPAILLTGYWPPSNEAVRQFSADPAQNPGGWQGSDWENRGYDVYSFFPEFSPPNCTSCGRGSGDLEVDYQDTLADFFAIANAVQPIAIITFSRTGASLSWELEMNQFNRAVWIDDYVSPRQPTPAPPDDSVPADFLRPTTLPTTNIVNAVNASGLGLNSFLCFSGSGGGFLSEFIAYCGVWYQSMHAGPTDPTWCVAAGHVHVGSGISWPIAEQAAEVTLREVIAHVDSLRTARVCQPDVGFQGPGAADLAVCGDALTTVGGSAEMRLTGGAPNAPAILVLSDQLGPTPLFGGVLAPNPVLASLAFDLDGDGQWLFEGVPTGVTLGISIYAQAVHLDLGQPSLFAFSNVVELQY
jgi:hypothetical protein